MFSMTHCESNQSSVMLWLVSIVVIIFLVVRRWKIQKFVELSKELKCGIKSYPLIGHAHLLAGGGVNRMTLLKKISRDALKNGGLSYIWIASKFYVVSVDAVDVEVILKKCLEKDNIVRFVRKLIGNGLIFATVPIWKPRRKVSAHTFSPANLNKFAKVFAEQSESMVKHVKSTFGVGAAPLWKYMTTYTFRSVCETALGEKLKVNGNTEKQLMESFDIIFKLIMSRMAEPWLQVDALYKLLPHHKKFEQNKEIIYRFVNEIIKKKRKKLKENVKTDNDDIEVTKSFLQLYIESSGVNRSCTDEELLEETLVMLLAGTDTSAVGLCFTICTLAQYPDVQEKVFQELQEVFGDSKRQVVVEDLPRLKYLEAVLRESLRLYPPVPLVVREINEDIKLPSGVTLTKGCGFLPFIWGINRNPLYWGEDAEQFRPERFLEGRSRHPAAFLSFSHGPRNCLGYQYAMISSKIALATFLRTYRVLPNYENSGSGDVNYEPMKLSYDIMMKDVDGFRSSVMLWLVSIPVIIFLVVRRWKIQKFVELSKELKCGIKSYPLIGHAHLLAGGGVNRMIELQNFSRDALKNGGLSHIWIGSKFYVVSVDAVDVEVILKKCLEKDNILRFARKVIGNGLIFAPVPIWKPRRKISAHTFSPANLNKFAKVHAEQSESMVKQVKSTFGVGAAPLWKYMTTYTFRSVCETALGVKLKVNGNTEKQLMESFDIIFKLIMSRMAEPWLQVDALYKLLPHHKNFEKNKEIVNRFVNEIIKEKRKKLKENIKTDNDDTEATKSFLELYIESSGVNRGCTDEELLEETLVMLLAGTDTSAVGLCFTIYTLSQYPDVQETVFQELQEVFGDSERQVVVEDLPRLKYLEAVLRESLRLNPPVPLVVREINEDIKLPSGLTLTKGCGFLLPIWGINRNPLYWGEDAEQFRPERFLEGRSRHPAAFLSFSHGPRNCLGYQYAMISLKIALATFLRTYRVLSKHENRESGDVNHEPMKLSYDVTMKDVDGFRVRLVERKNEDV